MRSEEDIKECNFEDNRAGILVLRDRPVKFRRVLFFQSV